MKTNGSVNQKKRAGFSMIEVLVASTILMVIVMLLAMLFQQTSLAWRTGVRRANSFMQVRALIGAIQRDASAAVDEQGIDPSLRGSRTSQFSGSSLSFFTLTGSGFNESGGLPYRALRYITYNGNGQRTEDALSADGSWNTIRSTQIKDLLESEGDSASSRTTLSSFTPAGDQGAGRLPLFVTFTANVTLKGNSFDIGAASAGPDGKWNTKDDIRTWVEE